MWVSKNKKISQISDGKILEDHGGKGDGKETDSDGKIRVEKSEEIKITTGEKKTKIIKSVDTTYTIASDKPTRWHDRPELGTFNVGDTMGVTILIDYENSGDSIKQTYFKSKR